MFKKNGNDIKPTREEAMTAIPVINSGVSTEKLETGEVLIIYPVTLRPILIKLAQYLGKAPEVTSRKLQLDILGTSVWHLLDGRRSVGQIIKEFAQTHQLHPKEAEVSVTQFLRSLGQRGLIGMR